VDLFTVYDHFPVVAQIHDYGKALSSSTSYFLEFWDVGGSPSHKKGRPVFYQNVNGRSNSTLFHIRLVSRVVCVVLTFCILFLSLVPPPPYLISPFLLSSLLPPPLPHLSLSPFLSPATPLPYISLSPFLSLLSIPPYPLTLVAGLILVHDLTNRKSHSHLSKWLAEYYQSNRSSSGTNSSSVSSKRLSMTGSLSGYSDSFQ
jgi:hypothetical protein